MNGSITSVAWIGGFSFLIIFFVLVVARRMMDVYYSMRAIRTATLAGAAVNAVAYCLLTSIIPGNSTIASANIIWVTIIPTAFVIAWILYRFPGSEISFTQSSHIGMIAGAASPILAFVLFCGIMAISAGVPIGLIIIFGSIPIILFCFCREE